jgi:hypothetical protein
MIVLSALDEMTFMSRDASLERLDAGDVEIRRDRGGSEVTALELLQHDLPTMGHKTPPVTPTLPDRSSALYA